MLTSCASRERLPLFAFSLPHPLTCSISWGGTTVRHRNLGFSFMYTFSKPTPAMIEMWSHVYEEVRAMTARRYLRKWQPPHVNYTHTSSLCALR
jgi:hypothetical protein